MADYSVNQNEIFEFTYSAKQQEEVERIRNKYLPKQESKVEQLRKLDKSTEKPGTVIGILLGIIGALFLGVGICTLVWNTSMEIFIAGVVIGILGLVLAGMAYPVYQKVTEKERKKIADQILALIDEL